MSASMEFEFIHDSESGGYGWRATCHPNFDAQLDSRGIVHDFIDHGCPPNYHTAEGELIAFGTIIYSRGHFGSLKDPERNLPIEMAGFLTGYWYGPDDCRIDDVPGLPDLLDPEDEDTLRRYSRSTMDRMMRDLQYHGMTYEGAKPALSELVKCRRRIQAWLREGWHQALTRFPHVSAPRLAELHEELQEAVRNKIRHIRDEMDVGARLVLRINADADAEIELTTREDLFDPDADEHYNDDAESILT